MKSERTEKLKEILNRAPRKELEKIILCQALKDEKLEEEIILSFGEDEDDRDLVIEEKIDRFLEEMTKWCPRLISYEDYTPDELVAAFDDFELADKFEGYEWDVDLYEYYEEQFNKADKDFDEILKLLEYEFKRYKNIDLFLNNIGGIIDALDEYDVFLTEDPYLYEERISEKIIGALKLVSEERRREILQGIEKNEYLNPDNKDLYTRTMGIVIDTFLGKKHFRKLDLKRMEVELENFNLSPHVRGLYEKWCDEIREEFGIKNLDKDALIPYYRGASEKAASLEPLTILNRSKNNIN